MKRYVNDLRVASVQFQHVPGDKAANLATVCAWTAQAAAADAELADLKAETRAICTGVRWIRSRRPELYQAVSTPTGREQDIRTVRFSTTDPEASNQD